MSEVKRLDIVKLGPTAQELHTVTGHPFDGRVWIKQHTTGAQRQVAVERCIVVGHAEDYQHAAMVTDRTNRSEERCPLCGGLNGAHGLVHTRHGNGGGSNSPCPHRTNGAKEES